jgi:hypothetical protein
MGKNMAEVFDATVAVTGARHQSGRHDRRWVGTYLPEPVLVETLDGKWRAALCYIAPAGESRPASNDYIDGIVRPAQEYGFPDWYVARLESFRPQ